MKKEHTAEEIRDRFLAEQGHIQRYVRFLGAIATIEHAQVRAVMAILKTYGLPTLKVGRGKRRSRHLSADEFGPLIESMQEILPTLEKAIAEQEALVAGLVYPDKAAFQNYSAVSAVVADV